MRKLIWIIAPLLLFIIFLPQIVSTPPFKGIFNRAFSKRFHADAKIESIRLSWLGPQSFKKITLSSPDMSGYIGEMKSASSFWRLNSVGDDFQIQDASVTFPTQGNIGLNHITAEIHQHALVAQGDALPKGHFTLQGKVFSSSDFDITYNLQDIPTLAIDQLVDDTGFLSQILGDVVKASGSCVLNESKGKLTLDLRAPNVATNLNATLDHEFMTLNEPFGAELHATPEFSKALLKNANPLFLTGVKSLDPIVFRIEPEGFRFPWREFNLQDIEIKQATLDMGRILCQTGKSLSTLISLFKNFRHSDESLVWFTPVAFSLHNGTLQSGRMDALISDAIHICTWGKIDLVRDTIDMILGICADTLSRSFGIENLASNYILKIPMEGTTQNPELDAKSAAAKIAALAVLNQLPNVGGKAGKMFGGTLNMIKKAQENQDDVPPPSRPYPWE